MPTSMLAPGRRPPLPRGPRARSRRMADGELQGRRPSFFLLTVRNCIVRRASRRTGGRAAGAETAPLLPAGVSWHEHVREGRDLDASPPPAAYTIRAGVRPPVDRYYR